MNSPFKRGLALLGAVMIALSGLPSSYAAERAPSGDVAVGHERPYTKPADLSVEKTTESTTLYRDAEVDFVIKVKNEDRDNPAIDVTASDTLTGDYDLVDLKCPERWSPNISGRYVSCSAPMMSPGESAVMILKAKVVGPCSDDKTYNRAVVNSLRDPNSANNMSTVELYIRCPEESVPSTEGRPSEPPVETALAPTCYEQHPPIIIGKTPDMNLADRRLCCNSRFTVSPADTGMNYNAVDCCIEGFERPDALTCCTSATRATAVGNASALSRCSR